MLQAEQLFPFRFFLSRLSLGRGTMQMLGQHRGTIWHRSDLQMHTPRDHGWVGDVIEDNDEEALQAKRREWAERLVRHCQEAEPPITAIAVTDHHDFCIGKYVQDAANGTDLIVFVGIEVTCSDNAQCLAIFDPATDAGIITKFLGSLPGVPPHGDNLPKGPLVQHCGLTVLELADLIEKDDHIRPVRAGSVCLNSFGRFAKWISASITPPPSLVPAR